MSTFLHRVMVMVAVLLFPLAMSAQQLTNANFEDWSGAAFDGQPQPKGWNASNVTQFGFKFNFAHKESGHNGGYCMMVQDQDVGAAGITETSPGYFSLGQPWVYVPSLTEVSKASAGTSGGISWSYRPDSMSVWIRRTGDNTDKEDFYLLYYAWSGTAKGEKYKAKNGTCTSHNETNEESDVRQELDGNECGTAQKASQICEGMWREKKTYSGWTNIRVPIYYFNNDVPTMMNIIFSASNYPNYRANSGLYAGNSLYVDDIELIYSSRIQKLYVGGKEWKAFDPNNLGIQTYSLGETATSIPDITARRGVGSLTNAHGKTVSFAGRELSGSEMTVTKGDLENKPTTITVKSGDGKSTTTYRIQFQRAPSSNATLAEIMVNGEPLSDFRPGQTNYNVELPYGTTAAPVVTYTLAEDAQTAVITQATSTTGKATITVTAADKTTKKTYTLNFSVGKLKDVTLQDIKVNGKSITGFTPSQAVYKVSLPVGTTTLKVEPVSAYPAGEQTIVITPSTMPTGDAINGATVQISVSAPGTTTTKVYKLTMKIEESSYSYLANLQVVGDQISDVNPAKPGTTTELAFDPALTTYYVNLKMGTKELPQILYTPGDEFQTITRDEGGLDGTTRISVLAGNKSDQTVYKLVFSTAKSEISTLAGIEIDGKPLEGFSPDITNYSYVLPVGTTTLPVITPIAHDEYQEITMVTGGVNGKTRITVTAGNGNTTNYYISFSVATYTDNTLKSLTVAGYDINFQPETNEYWVNLAQGTTELPEVTYELNDPNFQTASVRTITGLTGDYKITVRPQSGSSRTYIIHFSIATSSNVDLKMIYIDGVELEGFRADSLDYSYLLPEGVSTIPAVTYEKAEASQRVLSVLENKVQVITVTAESGAKRVYTVTFIVQASQNAFLQMIYLDGEALDGFREDSLNYAVQLKGATCPTITVDKNPGQQVTITAPYAAGRATIIVQPEEGAANTYTIDFEAVAPQTARLKNILVNGVGIDGFQPTQMAYTLQYEGELPLVEGVPEEDSQTVNVLWKDSVAWIHVQDAAGNKSAYSVTFTRTLSSNNTLEAIYANGLLIPGFSAATLTYEYTLAAGSLYPEISYKAAAKAQVVFFGQLAEGKWGITVMAENGTPATYTVQYTIEKYNDATLKNMTVEGMTLSPAFAPTTFLYELTIDEGAPLPAVTVEAREGQTIMQSDVDNTHQQVIVYAESGANNTYTITYTRKKSSNALLADILIDGVSIEGFDPKKEDYTDSIPWRSKFVPNVFAVAQLSTQTITTYFSRPNGVTRIHVEAQDGTTKDYTVAFPVRASDNTFLGDLYLDSEEAEITFKQTKTDYEVILPYEAKECPKMVFEKAEAEQRIDVISRPIGQTSQIIVTAENGDTRTYNILFKREVLKTKNLLSMIRIKELDQELSLKDKTKREFEVEMPFGSRSLTVEYEKMYPEQTVFIEPGGVHHPTYITVKANNDTVADEVYTIQPILEEKNPAVITAMTLNGNPLPGFDPYRYSYIVPVENKHIIRYTVNKGADINILEQNDKHWQAEVTYNEIVTTYDLWFYYVNDVLPNPEFDQWEKAAYNGDKPVGWNTLGQFTAGYSSFWGTYNTGDEVKKDGSSVVKMETKYNAFPLGGFVPAYITLGTINADFSVAAGSDFSVSGGVTFRNSPDELKVNFKQTSISNDKSRIVYQINGSLGSQEKVYTNTTTQSAFTTITMDLREKNEAAGVPQSMNIILNSFETEAGKNGTEASGAVMYVDWARFSFNHTLTGMKVDGIDAKQTGNAFEAKLTDPERIELPVLSFTGEVDDQAQLVTWSAATKDVDFETRTATIRNFAENGTDYTDYTLTVQRPLDDVNVLADLLIDTTSITGFAANKTDYTIVLPSSRHHLPDVMPVPASSLQTITTAYNAADSTMTITVKAEKASVPAKVYTVKFATKLSDDTTLKSIVAEGLSFDPDTRAYELTAEHWPLISFEKQSDLQEVQMINGLITVTAENGAVGTYTITRLDPAYTPSGVIDEFSRGTNIISGFGGADMSMEADQPMEYISFVRHQAADSVIFVQSPTQMTWSVPQTGKTYTWTYSTSLSDNADLAGFTVDGVLYADFTPGELTYELISDTTVVLAFLPNMEGQQVETSFESVTGGVRYQALVTAPNGVNTKTYSVQVTLPLSNDATLAGLLLDEVQIEGFDPQINTYNVIIPLPADGVKREQPKMPNITYVAGHHGQTILLERGDMSGTETVITVKSEDGTDTRYYILNISAEKSHCVDLTGITVNGEALDHFEPGRHFYSVSLKTDEVAIDYTSEDRFQTVETQLDVVKAGHEYHYTLHVTAEDGSASDYEIEVYVENQSNDAQLANIFLDGHEFDDFERALNPDLSFDGGNNNYEINLPAGTTILPEVNALLKMDGQKVDVLRKKDSILLHVTAVDGVTQNTYVLRFTVPLSKNADLGMIFLNGDSLQGFEPTNYFYQVELPVGTHELPEVAVQKGEAGQTITSIETDLTKLQTTIKVQAEDLSSRPNTYVVVFHFTQSDADTLLMIYEDGVGMTDFEPNSFYYTRSLPVGTTAFPELGWEEADDWQTVKMDTVEASTSTLVRQILVTSESGKKNTYTVSYTILKSDVDTLQMIFVDQKRLPGFQADVLEYYYQLTAAEAAELGGELPLVEYITGDEAQTVLVSQAKDSLSVKSLGYKSLVTVTAATGRMRTYTIHYPVELSSDATLNMIMVGGKPLANFDSERMTYKGGPTNPDLQLSMDANIPVISIVKKEDAQTYEIRVVEDTVMVDVWAEDATQITYTLFFERVLSDVTSVKNIILFKDGKQLPYELFTFDPEVYDYTIVLPFDSTLTEFTEANLPEIKVECDPMKDTLITVTQLSKTDFQVAITMVALNGDEGTPYMLNFQFTLSDDALLNDIKVKGVSLKDFKPTVMDYIYKLPYGSDSTAFITPANVTWEKSDPLATDRIFMEGGIIYIVVTAQDQKTENTYSIQQVIGKDTINTLKMIYLNGDSLKGFDPEVTFYTYVLPNTATAVLKATATPASVNAEVSVTEGIFAENTDTATTVIFCTAQDGSDRIYRIRFEISPIDDSAHPTANDVFLRRIPGAAQLFVTTIRSDVTFIMYDQDGHMVYYNVVPLADPNGIEVAQDGENRDVLLNAEVDPNSGLIVDVIPGQVYFYSFVESGSKKIFSGKIIAMP